MRYTVHDGWIIFPDGTRVRAICGAQDDSGIPVEFTNIFETGSPDPTGTIDAVGYGDSGVPFAASNPSDVSLSDVLRSGGSPTTAESINAGSLSDILRSGAESPPFDPGQMNPNVDSAIQQANDPNGPGVMDVVETVVKQGFMLAKTLLGGKGSANPASRNATATGPSLWQRVFGTTPGQGGNSPTAGNQLLLVALVVILGFVFLRLAVRGPARG